MADDHARDALLAQLQRDLAEQRAATDALRARLDRPRRRIPRRFLPLALAALLVALVPLATLAAAPFNDLTGGVHDANIGLIYDAGITKGCVPNVSYCPTANVTREEMASFLARTAGLGDNPPVANAKTAQTAQTAASATNATHAGSADTATSATAATNASALGGQPPSAYLPATGATTYRYLGLTAVPLSGTSAFVANTKALVVGLGPKGSATQAGTVLVPLPRPTTEFGRAMAPKSAQVCFLSGAADAGIASTTLLLAGGVVTSDLQIARDDTFRVSTTDTCYDLAVPSLSAYDRAIFLRLAFQNNTTSSQNVYLATVALTLTPLAAGTAEVPPTTDPNAPAKP